MSATKPTRSNIVLREFEESDYPEIVRFWEDRGGRAPSLSALPRLGCVAMAGGALVACGFCYLDACQSGVSWLGYMGSSKHHGAAGGRGLHHIIANLEGIVAELDYGVIVCSLADPSFVRFMENRGYTIGDTGMTHLTKPLTPHN